MKKNLTHFFIISLLLIISPPSIAQEPGKLLRSSYEIIMEGDSLYREEKYAEAIQVLKSVSRNDTNYVMSLNELSIAYLGSGDSLKAIDAAREGLSVKSQYRKILWENLGASYDQAGMYDKAMDAYQQGIKEFPHFYKYHYDIGVSYAKRKNDKEAVKHFQKSITMNPLHAASHYQIGLLAARNNKYVMAMLSLQMFVILEENTERTLKALQLIEAIGKNEFKVNPDSVVDITGDTDHFEDLEDIVRSKSALSERYKTDVKLNYYNIIKPMQAVMEKLSYNASDKGFWMQHYVPFYVELWKQGYFESLMYHSFSSLKDDDVQRLVKSNKSKITKFITWAVEYLIKIRADKKAMVNGKEMSIHHWYYDNGALQAIGVLDEKKKIYTGYWQLYNATGNLKNEGSYNDKGEPDGKWKSYYADGSLREIFGYTNGTYTGNYTIYYKNGQEKEKGSYNTAGKMSGTFMYYYASGMLQSKVDFADNIKDGKGIYYYDNGMVRKEVTYKKDLLDGKYKEYYRNGSLKTDATVTAGKLTGKEKEYNARNQLIAETNYINDLAEGEAKKYFGNGSVNEKGAYKAGKKTGLWITYYENGKVAEEETYVAGLLEGLMKKYDDDGVLFAEFEFKKDVLRKYKFIDKKGKVLASGEEKNNTLNFNSYYPDGTLRAEGKTVNGKREGLWTEYYSTGRKSVDANFKDGKKNGPETSYYRNGVLKSKYVNKDDLTEGYYVSYYKNGKKQKEGYYINDEMAGDWIEYEPNGTISEKSYYIKGTIDGINEYFDASGRPTEQYYYDDNTLSSLTGRDSTGRILFSDTLVKGQGTITSLHHDKSVHYKIPFINGIKEGSLSFLTPAGKPYIDVTYKRGEESGLYKKYHFNGKVAVEAYYIDGDLDSTYRFYDWDGNLVQLLNYKYGNRDGLCKWLYGNGKIRFEGVYKDGDREGYFMHYDDDGTTRMRLNYKENELVGYSYPDKDGNFVPDIPVKNGSGHIVTYYSNGNKSADFTIDGGFYEGKYQTWHSNGQLHDDQNYKNGEWEGKVMSYYPNGKTEEDESYLYDELDGVCKYYTPKGVLKELITFSNGTRYGLTQLFDATGKLKKQYRFYRGFTYDK